MRKETDLSRVKETAQVLLMTDIKKTKFPWIVSHPFTLSSFAVCPGDDGQPLIINLVEDEKGMKKWRQEVAKQIEKAATVFGITIKSYNELIDLCERQEFISGFRLGGRLIMEIAFGTKDSVELRE